MSSEEQRIRAGDDVTVEISMYDEVRNVRVARRFTLSEAYQFMMGFTHFFGLQATTLVDELVEQAEELVIDQKENSNER